MHSNKQGFQDCEPYARLEEWLGRKADEYWDSNFDNLQLVKYQIYFLRKLLPFNLMLHGIFFKDYASIMFEKHINYDIQEEVFVSITCS